MFCLRTVGTVSRVPGVPKRQDTTHRHFTAKFPLKQELDVAERRGGSGVRAKEQPHLALTPRSFFVTPQGWYEEMLSAGRYGAEGGSTVGLSAETGWDFCAPDVWAGSLDLRSDRDLFLASPSRGAPAVSHVSSWNLSHHRSVFALGLCVSLRTTTTSPLLK